MMRMTDLRESSEITAVAMDGAVGGVSVASSLAIVLILRTPI
jgi:hypothetical protein